MGELKLTCEEAEKFAKDLAYIKEAIYGKEKMSFIYSHLLRNFTIEELITIKNFLIERTPNDD